MAISLENEAVLKLFDRLNSVDSDAARPALEAIGRAIVSDIQMGFKRGVDPQGKAWEKLKLRQGQPLRKTGALQRSITFTIKGNTVEVGTNIPYAPYHQHGAVIKPKKPGGKLNFFAGGRWFSLNGSVLPARQFIGYGPRQEKRVANALRGYIKGILGNV